jgi:hypothetical protein
LFGRVSDSADIGLAPATVSGLVDRLEAKELRAIVDFLSEGAKRQQEATQALTAVRHPVRTRDRRRSP